MLVLTVMKQARLTSRTATPTLSRVGIIQTYIAQMVPRVCQFPSTGRCSGNSAAGTKRLVLARSLLPGDVMYVEVNAGPGGLYFFLEDLTTITFSSYSFAGNYGFIGKSAEWIASHSCVSDDTSEPPYDCIEFPNLIALFFDGGAAQTANGHVYYPGSTAASTAVITMRDDSDTQDIEVVSQGSGGYEGKHSLWLQTTGCAWSGGCVPSDSAIRSGLHRVSATQVPGTVNKNEYPQGEER